VYLRLAEDAGDDMTAEAWVHDALRRRGLRVPDVVAVGPVGEPLDRGVLVVTAMPGVPLAAARLDRAAAARVVHEAGREIAVAGQLAVDGFGFVCRDQPPLAAPSPDARSLLLDGFDARLARAAGPLGGRLTRRAGALVARHAGLLHGCPSRLAHGDFDGTHIYVHAGRYSGLIDFGEMRGAPPLYDAGHFAVHDDGPHAPLLPALLAGTQDVAPLPGDADARIALVGLLLGVDLVERFAARGRPELVARFGAAVARLADALAAAGPG
jgi:Ser/Thr protein kinase RdoA (MazF antagonist)